MTYRDAIRAAAMAVYRAAWEPLHPDVPLLGDEMPVPDADYFVSLDIRYRRDHDDVCGISAQLELEIRGTIYGPRNRGTGRLYRLADDWSEVVPALTHGNLTETVSERAQTSSIVRQSGYAIITITRPITAYWRL